MLNLSSGIIEKLGGPFFPYLPDGPSEFSRPQMLDTMYWFRFGHTLGAMGFAVIVLCLARYSDWWLNRFWSWGPFQWMGRLSYTLYIWHALPYILIIAATGGENASIGVQLIRTPVLIAAAFAVSMPVYYLIEMRVLRMKLRFSSEKEALDLRTGKMVQVHDGKVVEDTVIEDPVVEDSVVEDRVIEDTAVAGGGAAIDHGTAGGTAADRDGDGTAP